MGKIPTSPGIPSMRGRGEIDNGSGFRPTDIPGCVFWLRSDSGVTKDGSNLVSSWVDQSGSGGNFTQTTDSLKPIWYDGQINGYPAMLFDGDNDILNGTTDFLDFERTDSWTTFYVFKWVGGVWGDLINKLDPTDEYKGWRNFYDVGIFQVQIINNHHNNFLACYDNTNTISTGHYYIASMTYTGNSLPSGVTFYLNGSVGVTASNGTLSATIKNDVVPKIGGPDDYGNMYIAEEIIYNSALSNTLHSQVLTYLNGRYVLWV